MTRPPLSTWEKLKDFDYRIKLHVIAYLSFLRARILNPKRRTIYCFPETPVFYHSLFAVYHTLGYTITVKDADIADCLTRFEDATTGAAHVAGMPNTTRPIINLKATDISKTHIEAIHKKVFGYSAELDPQTHNGPCVKKSNVNALHDGILITCPALPEEGFVYQKFIDTEENGMAADMRVAVVKGTIPVLTIKYRRIPERFRHTRKARIAKVADMLSTTEIAGIIRFCDELGLDFCELDILRDKQDKRIYIIDANNTPARPHPGWPGTLSLREYLHYDRAVAQAFKSAFLIA